jgi:hypothetical protein
MFSNRFGFVVLAVGCIAAAGVGGYFAARQNAVTPAPVIAAPAPATPQAPQAVQETEGLVGDVSKNTASAPAARAPQLLSSSVKRTEAPARPAARKTQPQTVTAQNAPTLERSWPTAAPPRQDPAASVPPPADSGALRQEEPRPVEPPPAPEPPAKTFQELVVAANSVVGLQMVTSVTSERAKVEDRVEARVIRDVRVGGQVAIPAGSRTIGAVMSVERGGKFKESARLGIRFHTLVLADGTELPITTETIYRNGEPPGNASAAKVGGGAVAGAILGAIIGGAKGAAIGGAAGAGAGTAVVMSGDPHAATFPAGSDVTARFLSPVSVTVEK